MNLRQIANNAITSINPNITSTLRKYAGEGIGAGRKPVPKYYPDQQVTIQLQPVPRGEMQHVDGLNVAGLAKIIYVNGNYFSVNRALEKGGDLFEFEYAGAKQTWLVVEPVELWPDWCRLLCVLQLGEAQGAGE